MDLLTPTEAINRLGPDARVRIWSAEHHAYWRTDAHGYTIHADEAGEWSLEAAHALTRSCGQEKSIRFEDAAGSTTATAVDGSALAATIAAVPPGWNWLLRSDMKGFFANVTSADFVPILTGGETVVWSGHSHRARGPTPHGALAEATALAEAALAQEKLT